MSEQVNDAGPMYRPSQEEDRGIDAGTMRLLYIMGGGGLVILAGIAIYALTGRPGAEIPVVQPDARPVRVRPEIPGGMALVPENKRANPADSRLAPGTEEPNPNALLAIPDPVRTAPPPVPVRSAAKSTSVQLSSAKSEAGAQATWDKLMKKMPDVLGHHRPLFLKTNEAGPTPWRLRTGGFADGAQAKAFCEKVKAKGVQCTVPES